MLSRRHLLQSLAALGLVAAADPVVEPVRRFWALDRTMAGGWWVSERFDAGTGSFDKIVFRDGIYLARSRGDMVWYPVLAPPKTKPFVCDYHITFGPAEPDPDDFLIL